MMKSFNLPKSTIVNKNIPKNAFDDYTNSKQKRLFSEKVLKILWGNKISNDTVNLPYSEISEIQIFEITLKTKELIQPILDVIDKAIPYHIVFRISHLDWSYISTSSKHPHPVNEDNAVIDWTFTVPWFKSEELLYHFSLTKSIDYVYKDFCAQLTGKLLGNQSMEELVKRQKEIHNLQTLINKLKTEISKNKQFKIKVELNIELKNLESELSKLLDNLNKI